MDDYNGFKRVNMDTYNKRVRDLNALFQMDQLTAHVADFISIKELLEQHGVEIQPHEKPWYMPCLYSPYPFYCPLEKRMKCTELVCTAWLRDYKEGED
jgi:hypothetical protein